MGGAAGEEGEGQHQELRRAKDFCNRLPRPFRLRRVLNRRLIWRVADQKYGRQENDPGTDADHQHGRAPVAEFVDQEPGERRNRHRRHAHAGGDKRYGETAVVIEPAHGKRDHRRHEGTGRQADKTAIEDLEGEKALRAAGENQGQSGKDRADQHDDARAEPVAGRAPYETAQSHDDEIDCHGAGDRRMRPAGLAGDRL
ncbi:hypothetical protein D3C87_1520080 [compost metagenome]